MTSQPGLKTIAIYIFPNILQRKDHPNIKFAQLIERNKRNTFLQKLCGKLDWEISSRPLFFLQKA